MTKLERQRCVCPGQQGCQTNEQEAPAVSETDRTLAIEVNAYQRS